MEFIILGMNSFLPIIIAVIAVALVYLLISMVMNKLASVKKTDKKKSRQTIVNTASRKLAQDPHHVPSLLALSEIYFQEHLWDKAMPLLTTLLDRSSVQHDINRTEVALKQGICAVKLNKIPDAIRGLSIAYKDRPDNYETNFYLGQAFVQSGEFAKAVPLLRKAISINHDETSAYKYLGNAYYSQKQYKESLPYLKKSLDTNPEDKETLFKLADALNETGGVDQAVKIFMHLRTDPNFGAKACLEAGIIHANTSNMEKAISDFEIGLRHTTAPIETLTDLRYRLAQCFIRTNELVKGLNLLKQIQMTVSNYKDVSVLIARYTELSQNQNLQTYLIGSTSDFIALCRKIVMTFYKKAHIHIQDIQATREQTEILTEIETSKWQDTVIFRFYRTTGSTGELFIRDFHGKIRDIKAGKGICFTAGVFTEEAKKYIDGRPIDLVDKQELAKILLKIDENKLFNF